MKFQENEENRVWVLNGLDQLHTFVRDDADFRGNKSYEEKAIEYQRQFVDDGKYRVVFLGTFNVGKSTAINAFLGGGYLPMDVEECTSKLTFIQRGDDMHLMIALSQAVSNNEMGSLKHLFEAIPARPEASDDRRVIHVHFDSNNPDGMRQSLEPLVTVMADEDYPLLASFREKIEELNLYLPSDVLEEDIVFVDTPGVHSVSETRQEITYGIIERSHLVISFVDSALAGNIHDLNFIKRIIKWRGRHVFFVLNKADKLEPDEIDVRGTRGPAKLLFEAFRRHEIPETSEVFFLSGYRALRAQELERDQIALEALLDDNRLSLPTSVAKRIEDSDDPTRDLAAYLMGQSRFPHLKERLLDYLLNDNKAGTVLETAARFVAERSDDFVVSLENELAVAKDPTKFDELRANRDALLARLEDIRNRADHVLNEYKAKSMGGPFEGEAHPGYAATFKTMMSEEAIQTEVIDPLLKWLRTGDNLKNARKSKFKTLTAQTEHQVDEFVSTLMATLHEKIAAVEDGTQSRILEHLGEVRGLRMHMTEPKPAIMSNLEVSTTRSYVAFGASGAAIGVAAGAAVGSVVPVVGTAIGAGVGALVGAVGAFFARLAWSEERWLKKLEPMIRENARTMLVEGSVTKDGSRTPSILESVTDYLESRADAFHNAVRGEVDNAVDGVQQEVDGLLAREAEIRAEAEAIVARLEPKVDRLHALRARAQTIIAAIGSTDTLAV